MGRLNACPATSLKSQHVSTQLTHSLFLLHESLSIGSRLETAITAAAQLNLRNDCRQTMMALHSHMNNLFDLLDLQRQTEVTYYKPLCDNHYILSAIFFQ
jgi:hypothetical protein